MGIRFHVLVDVPGGGKELVLSASDVVSYIRSPLEFVASKFGLTLVEYNEWVANDGRVQCSGMTRSGSRRKNRVVTQIQLGNGKRSRMNIAPCTVVPLAVSLINK